MTAQQPGRQSDASVTDFTQAARERGYPLHAEADGDPEPVTELPPVLARSQPVGSGPSWSDTRAHATAALGDLRRRAVWHLVRSPIHLGRLMWYTTRGAAISLSAPFVWASTRGTFKLQQSAATNDRGDEWLKLDRHRVRLARWRWSVLLGSGAGIAAGLVWLNKHPLPDQVTAALIAAAVAGWAWIGRPEGKPLIASATPAPQWVKLTPDITYAALISLRIPELNAAVKRDPNAMRLVHDIVRDGPGHLAAIDLPEGVVATRVIAKRGELASGLRLPHDQVWPAEGTEHPGRLNLWVGLKPASQTPAPSWPWLKNLKPHSVFEPFPGAFSPRGTAIYGLLPERNYLVGGEPGCGKTTFVRTLIAAAALDPYTELIAINFKGTGDFHLFARMMSLHGNGLDDKTRQLGLMVLRWLRGEAENRAQLLDKHVRHGRAPKSKVTRELAETVDSGLHYLVVVLDEVQELFTHPVYGREARELCVGLIKILRALGITLVLSTQTTEGDSIPVGVTRACSNRWAGAIADHRANDMILGSGMWAAGYRANQFKLHGQTGKRVAGETARDDAGWGLAVGFGVTQPLCSYELTHQQQLAVADAGESFRRDAGTDTRRSIAHLITVDFLADLARVWPVGAERAWSKTLAERLSALHPDEYRNLRTGTPEVISRRFAEQARAVGLTVHSQLWGVDAEGVKRNLAGLTRADLDAVLARRKP